MDYGAPPAMNYYLQDQQPPSANHHPLYRAFSDLERRVAQLERRGDIWKSAWGLPAPSLAPGSSLTNPVGSRQSSPIPSYNDVLPGLGVPQLSAEPDQRPHTVPPGVNSVRFGDPPAWGPLGQPSRHTVGFATPDADTLSQSQSLANRALSHKSDGFRTSSASQSVRSIGSGRPNATTPAPAESATSNGIRSHGLASVDASTSVGTIASDHALPTFSSRQSVPAMVRCWVTPDFKHDNLVLGAVCACSEASGISRALVESQNLSSQLFVDSRGRSKITLSVYLSEAVLLTTSSSGHSSDHSIPFIHVTFSVVNDPVPTAMADRHAHLFFGCDVLNIYSVDVLFSSSTIQLTQHTGSRLSVPFVGPDDVGHVTFACPANRSSHRSIPSSLVGLPYMKVDTSAPAMANGSATTLFSNNADSTDRLVKMADPYDLACPSAGVPSAVDVDALTTSCDKRFDVGLSLNSTSESDNDLSPSSPSEANSRNGQAGSTGPTPGSSVASPSTNDSVPAAPSQPAGRVASQPTAMRPSSSATMSSSGPVTGKTSYRAAVAQRNQQPKARAPAPRSMLVFRSHGSSKSKDGSNGGVGNVGDGAAGNGGAPFSYSSRLNGGSSGRLSVS